MSKEAIILAGGLGTRLRSVVSDKPKSMAVINGRPFLDYQIKYLESWGIDHVILSVGYKREIIQNYFGEQFSSVKIDYAVEEEPLGTGGGIKNALPYMKGRNVLVFNGDTFFEVNLKRVFDYQRIKDADVTLVLRFVDDVSRYGCVEMDEERQITGFTEKGGKSGEGFINGGVYYFAKNYLLDFDLPDKFSIEKDFFEKYCKEERFFGFKCHGYFLDIGIPEDYKKAHEEFVRLPY
ncbi:MAG: nucleotidyltransferase family protein [Bacteroidales bacterium]|nr:nucleotidyltransferase family protein [Bacteroidales bacterium]MCF8388055.1 nucleotidyltransferase family protein [Bacteroidales bacterium]MCF8398553.1 nucleotidyltransferase family protein [Bacteroidales bacterium]